VTPLLTFDFWFRPKRFESERLYALLGALLIKRFVPTGGDLVMQNLRRRNPGSSWIKPNLRSLRQFEQRTRVNESVHLVGSVSGIGWAIWKYSSGLLSLTGLSVALVLACIIGFWPITLQRYNRLRLYRVMEARERHHQR
jgi:hypothetical protein